MRVGIVGAGVTGLALTHYLAARDVDVVTFEASDRPGGVVRTDRIDGRVVEYGPQRVRLTPSIEDLVADLDLDESLLRADDDLPLYVYANGSLGRVPRSLREFLTTDLLSVRGKLRMLAEPATAPARADERAGDLFSRKFGTEAYRNVVEPLFGGIYGSDPAEMPAEFSLSGVLALEREHGSLLRVAVERLVRGGDSPPPVSFVDGLATLPEALYDANAPWVHLETPVSDVSRSDGDGRYRLRANGRSATVDEVVVTTPAGAAAGILDGLEGACVDPLRELTYNSLVLVHLHSEAAVEGFGYQVRRDEPLETLGVTWNDSLFDRDGVFTVFMGGAKRPDAVSRPPAELGEVARREFERVMDVDASVLGVEPLPEVMPAYDASWAALDDVTLPEGVRLATNYTARVGVPSRVREAKRIAGEISASD